MEFSLPEPNERQKEFLKSRERYILYGGAKGGGKSWSIRTKQVLRRLKYPKSKGLLLRRTFPELLRNHILKLQEELPKDIYKYNEQKHMFTFSNGSILELGSCQYEGDVFNYQGAEYDDIGVDEASQFSEYMFNQFKTNIRTTKTDMKLQMYLGTNPGGPGHGWIKRLFIDKQFQKGEDPKEYKFIPAKVYDNHALMKADPQYVQELETLPEDLRRAFLEGDWTVFSGQVFPQIASNRSKYVVPNLPIYLEECEKVIGFDWGYNDHTAVVFLAKSPEGRIFQFREMYGNRKTPEEWAEIIRTAIEVTPVSAMYLPHDCFSKQQGRDSIAEVFKRNIPKISIRRADTLSKGARTNGLALFQMYLSDAPDGMPYFQMHESCVNTARTLPELVYEEREGKAIDDVNCFVAGTKIDGRNIENIKEGELVDTPIGKRKVIYSGLSGFSKTIKVSLSNGCVLEGTPNHKVFVWGKGLVELQNLASSDLLVEKNICRQLSTKELNTQDLKENLRDKIVERMEQLNPYGNSTVKSAATSKEYIKLVVLSAIRTFFKKIMGQEPPKPVRIVAVGFSEEKKPVYNLTVEEAHLYYANNILVTNTDGEDHLYDAVRAVFLEWGKPKGKGGGVRPPYPDKRRRAPTVVDGEVPALDISKLLKKKKRKSWLYI